MNVETMTYGLIQRHWSPPYLWAVFISEIRGKIIDEISAAK